MISKLCRYQVVENDHKKSRLKFLKQVLNRKSQIRKIRTSIFFSVKNSVKLKFLLVFGRKITRLFRPIFQQCGRRPQLSASLERARLFS